MGYTKIVQFGDTTLIYEYEKNIRNNKRPNFSSLLKGTNRKKKKRKISPFVFRSDRSIKRSRDNFFRLVHHNNCNSNTIHFLTLTFAYDIDYKKASQYQSQFFARFKSHYPEIPLRYISVPEKTKKNRFHFHLLVYDLPSKFSQFERETRNLQRLFHRGYLDILPVSSVTPGLSGYLSKYLSKSLKDQKNQNKRGYNSSRNIKKITSYGSNTLSTFTDIIPTKQPLQVQQYNVPYLGRCIKKIIIN